MFYEKKGKLVYANPSALEIYEISKLENILGINLFNNPDIASKKEKLINEGFVKFQSKIKNIKNNKSYKSKKTEKIFDWTVSLIESGFLVQIQDINNLKKFQDSIQESEEKYRRWFEDDLTGDFIATPEGEILECNPAFVEIYGFSSRQKAVGSYISKFNIDDWINLIARLKYEHKIYDHQSWHKKPDNEGIHVVANVIGIFNDLNELIQVKGYVFDDTERKEAEEALKESEEKYHSLFDEDLTGDFIATLEGEILECNPSFAEIYGFYDCKQVINWNISKSNPFDWPYMITRLKKERKLKGYQSWQRRSDGMRIHIVANVVGIFNDSDELVQVKGYIFDDTERKRVEDELNLSKSRFKEILDSIQDGFFALDHQWRFIYVNKCAGEYFGVESEDIIGQNIWERFPELRGTTYETIFRNAIDKQEIQRFEAHGRIKPYLWLDFSIYPSNGGISVFCRDITNEKVIKTS